MSNITETGRSAPISVASGLFFLNLAGDFGGTSIRVDWAKNCEGPWNPLLDEDGAPTAITDTFNKQVTLGLGAVSFFATGGAAIDVAPTLKRL